MVSFREQEVLEVRTYVATPPSMKIEPMKSVALRPNRSEQYGVKGKPYTREATLVLGKTAWGHEPHN